MRASVKLRGGTIMGAAAGRTGGRQRERAESSVFKGEHARSSLAAWCSRGPRLAAPARAQKHTWTKKAGPCAHARAHAYVHT
eukprot:4719589-Pleurochrysis_carterae.AAC.6